MKNVMIKMRQLENFTEKLLNYAGFDNYKKEQRIFTDNKWYTPDYIIEKGDKKYTVEIRNSLDFDTIKMRFFVDEFKDLKKLGFNNIVIVYNAVTQSKRERFKDIAIILDISNILYIIKNDVILSNELMGILDFSIENIELKEPGISIEIQEKENLDKENKLKILNSIGTGKNCFKTYQTFCMEVLRYLFLDVLDLWEGQERTDDGLNIYDLICKIKNNVSNEFFITLEKYFKSKYIIFEFKNYEERITQYEVCTTEKYLYETALRKVAIIITRKGINDNGNKMIKGILRETGKLIIVLDDNDIKAMIKLKEDGENPSVVLINKLDFLLTHLEK